jgi:hypothetical protein
VCALAGTEVEVRSLADYDTASAVSLTCLPGWRPVHSTGRIGTLPVASTGAMGTFPNECGPRGRSEEYMALRIKAHHWPSRLAVGAFVLNSGLTKRAADDQAAARLHDFVSGAYPALKHFGCADFHQAALLGGDHPRRGVAVAAGAHGRRRSGCNRLFGGLAQVVPAHPPASGSQAACARLSRGWPWQRTRGYSEWVLG